MKADLERYIGQARWFGGKGREHTVTDVRRAGRLSPAAPADHPQPCVGIELVTVEYTGTRDHEVYQVPLAYYGEEQERLEHAYVGSWEDPDLGEVHAYDALHDRAATSLWLEAFVEERADDELAFPRLPGHELDLTAHSTLFSGEQSNSSVAFGEDSLMKVFRKVTPGHNPDIEIHEALTRAETEHVAALYGWVEIPGAGDEPPIQLAMLQEFLRTASDGWDLALASVRDLYAEADLHADEVGGDFGSESHRLGVATGQVHDALASSFPTTEWGADDLRALADAMRDRLDAALEVVPQLAPHADALREIYAAVERISDTVLVQRVHGDFHLGQTLRTTRGWRIVDFEGEPAKPLADRVLPDSPWRDVAGMLRSLDYAAHAVEADVEVDEEGRKQIAYRAAEWAQRNQEKFLEGYVEVSGRTASGGISPEQHLLVAAYQADKAVYETVYEARNRPSWITIPLGAIARLAESAAQEEES